MKNYKTKGSMIYRMSFTAIMAALVFVCTSINIQIPLPGLNVMLHLGNVLCILSALILGAIPGGISAGVGSFLYDLTNPLYITSAPFTLIFKFIMAFICAKIAFRHGKNAEDQKNNVLAAVVGMFVYIVLYLGKTFVANMFLGVAMQANLLLIAEGAAVSAINTVIAIAIAVPLGAGVRKALRSSSILDKIEEER